MWQNRGRDVFIRAFGQADWDRYSEAQFVPIPPPTLARRARWQLKLATLFAGFSANAAKTGRRPTNKKGGRPAR